MLFGVLGNRFVHWIYSIGLFIGSCRESYPMHLSNAFIQCICQMGLSDWFIRCICQMGLSYGSCREILYPIGLSDAFIRCICQMGLFNVFIRCICQMGLSYGSCREILYNLCCPASPCPRHPCPRHPCDPNPGNRTVPLIRTFNPDSCQRFRQLLSQWLYINVGHRYREMSGALNYE